MTTQESITILTEINKWRREQPPYNTYEVSKMPYTPKEFGEAIDTAIKIMRNEVGDIEPQVNS